MTDKFRLGLVGGIASGKSTVAGFLRDRGWAIVDADKVAHEVYAPGTDTVDSIRSLFGAGVVLPDGSVDRKALGTIVFSDPEALKRLEALVHPATRERIALRMDEEAARRGKVVLEMTLLYRWPEMASKLDSVVGVRCPDEIRLDRLVARSGLDRAEALRRLAAQVAQERILAPAAHVLDNAGTVDDLERGIARFL
ncbi:MAG TPA: dephospho-CoA kinase [Fibrobacteria bacterium]|nr:dephospho-CoA kinase [Fibrobacteria bacterium]